MRIPVRRADLWLIAVVSVVVVGLFMYFAGDDSMISTNKRGAAQWHADVAPGMTSLARVSLPKQDVHVDTVQIIECTTDSGDVNPPEALHWWKFVDSSKRISNKQWTAFTQLATDLKRQGWHDVAHRWGDPSLKGQVPYDTVEFRRPAASPVSLITQIDGEGIYAEVDSPHTNFCGPKGGA